MAIALAAVENIQLKWLVVASVVCGAMFPISLFPASRGFKRRLGLFLASLAGFAAAFGFGALRGRALDNTLILYCDAMICASFAGAVISWIERRRDKSIPVDVEKWTRFGMKLSGVLLVILCLLIFLEYAPIWG